MVRVEDVLKSTRAAVEEGVVPGGGVSLIRALKAPKDIEGYKDDHNVVKNGDERLVVLNQIAMSVVDSLRGQHTSHVFAHKDRPGSRMLNS